MNFDGVEAVANSSINKRLLQSVGVELCKLLIVVFEVDCAIKVLNLTFQVFKWLLLDEIVREPCT